MKRTVSLRELANLLTLNGDVIVRQFGATRIVISKSARTSELPAIRA